MNTTISHELVSQITSLVQAWNTADRRLREMFHGWEHRATRGGLERGFYLQLGQLPGVETVVGDEIDNTETAGRMLYHAYVGGAVTAGLDIARS